MKPMSSFRPTVPEDLPALKEVIDKTGLFPSDRLDGMIAGFFADDPSEEIWLTYDNGQPVGVAYCAPEPLTEGTWNLYRGRSSHPGVLPGG